MLEEPYYYGYPLNWWPLQANLPAIFDHVTMLLSFDLLIQNLNLNVQFNNLKATANECIQEEQHTYD